MTRRLAAGLLLSLLSVVSCAGDDADVASGTTRGRATPSTSPTTTTTEAVRPEAEPVTTTAAPVSSVRVLLAGDSIMVDATPALEAAFDRSEPDVETAFALVPAIPRTPEEDAGWRRTVAAHRPDVLVFLVGIWEAATVHDEGPGVGEPGWDAQYRGDVVEPWLDEVAAAGVEVVWIGMPPVNEPVMDGRVRAVMAVLDAVSDERTGVRFVDAGSVLAPGGTYTDSVPGDDGVAVRVRRTDGLHLCPDGAARIAALVAGSLVGPAAIEVTPGWETGPWRDRVGYDVEAECPAA